MDKVDYGKLAYEKCLILEKEKLLKKKTEQVNYSVNTQTFYNYEIVLTTTLAEIFNLDFNMNEAGVWIVNIENNCQCNGYFEIYLNDNLFYQVTLSSSILSKTFYLNLELVNNITIKASSTTTENIGDVIVEIIGKKQYSYDSQYKCYIKKGATILENYKCGNYYKLNLYSNPGNYLNSVISSSSSMSNIMSSTNIYSSYPYVSTQNISILGKLNSTDPYSIYNYNSSMSVETVVHIGDISYGCIIGLNNSYYKSLVLYKESNLWYLYQQNRSNNELVYNDNISFLDSYTIKEINPINQLVDSNSFTTSGLYIRDELDNNYLYFLNNYNYMSSNLNFNEQPIFLCKGKITYIGLFNNTIHVCYIFEGTLYHEKHNYNVSPHSLTKVYSTKINNYDNSFIFANTIYLSNYYCKQSQVITI